MNYDAAVIGAHTGLKLIRPHWHWIYMSASEKTEGGLALYHEADGHERGEFKPTRSDRKATDWMVSK